MTNLLHIGVGSSANTEPAVLDVNFRRDEAGNGFDVNVGFDSLKRSGIGVVVLNALVGFLSGSASSVSDLLLNNNLGANGLSAAGFFSAFFIADAAAVEVGRRWADYRRGKFMARADNGERFQAMLDEGRGVWVVASGDVKLSAGNLNAAMSLAKGQSTVLSDAEFRAFEQRVAAAGGTLRTYRVEKDADRVTVITKVGGKLQSVDRDPAVVVWENGAVTSERWFETQSLENGPITTPGP